MTWKKRAKKATMMMVFVLLNISTISCLIASESRGYVVADMESKAVMISSTTTSMIPRPQNGTIPPLPQDGAGPRPPQNGTKRPSPSEYTIEQTLSDGAQRNTIAFDALAFLTGNLGADSFLPPGKMADFFGFQYMRDNDPDKMGHNTDFLTRAANNMLYVLSSDQKAELVNLAKSQVSLINRYAYDRFPLMKAFRRQLEGDMPQGGTTLSKSAVMEYSAKLYSLDASVSLERATVYGRILRALNQNQRDYLNKMAAGGMLSWPELHDQIDKRSLSHDEHVAVMTYAGDLCSWYIGSVEADTYFCPEGQGTYFGSFYMKDAPAIGNPGYSIGTDITGNIGDAFLRLLTDSQRELVTSLVEIQRADLSEIVAKRRAISSELRRLMAGESVDKETVLSLGRRYGELDGEISYYYATHFSEVSKTLTIAQKTQLVSLRGQLLGDMMPAGAFLYSQPMAMPTIADTDFLFGVYTSATITASSTTPRSAAATSSGISSKPMLSVIAPEVAAGAFLALAVLGALAYKARTSPADKQGLERKSLGACNASSAE